MNTWTGITKILHFGMAISIVAQLLVSLVMEYPDSPAQAASIGATFFKIHETVGIVAVAFVLVHWLWLMKSPDNRFADLLPWGATGRRRVIDELKCAVRGEQLEGGPHSGGLVGLVHGLGLLTAGSMALTGLALFFLLPEGGEKPGALAGGVMEIHAAIASLMWIYVIAHIAMAYRHHLSGHTTLKDMFKLRS
jgi:cytochrome b561